MSNVNSLMLQSKFLPLFICQFIASLRDNFIRTTFATLITYYSLDISELSRVILVTLSLACFVMPFCIFSATGGKLADKYEKSSLIHWLKLANLLINSVVILGFILKSNILLLVGIFAIGVQATLFSPAKYSILPESVEEKELILANGLIEAGTFMSILLGTILGGVVISSDFDSTILVCTIIALFAITEYVSAYYIPHSKHSYPEVKVGKNLIKESIECVQLAKSNHKAFLAILGISWFWLIGGILISEMPHLTRDVFQADKSVYIMLLSAFSIGTGIGSMLCHKLLNDEITTKYVPISMIFMSFFMFDLWLTSSNVIGVSEFEGIHYFLSHLYGVRATLDIMMISIIGGIYIVPLYALLQIEFRRENRSIAIAANNILNSLFMIGSSLLVIILTSIGFTLPGILFIMTAANLFITIYICKILPDTVIRSIFQWVLKALYRVEVIGIENYAKAGNRVLIVANHCSFLDPLLLGAFLPGRQIFAIDTYIANRWWIRPLLKFLRAYPVDPTHPMAVKTIIDQLKANRSVIIFPEGRITVTGSLMKIYEGPGMIADKSNATILPIRLEGPERSIFSRMRGKITLKLFPKVRIIIQEPRKLDVPKNYYGRDRRYTISNKFYDIMSDMMFNKSQNNSTLFEHLIMASKHFGLNKEILNDSNKGSLTYLKLLAGSFTLGEQVERETVAGEYIGVLLPNVTGTVVLFFASLLYQRIPAMLNFSTGSKNIISSCKTAKINKVFTSRVFIEKANLGEHIEVLSADGVEILYLEDIRKRIKLGEKLSGMFKAFFPTYFADLISEKIGVKQTPVDPAVVLFTSGSEGLPKGVVLTHSNLIANLKQVANRIDFTGSDKVFNALPIFHAFGLTGGMILPLLSGVETFFYTSPLHYRIIPEIIYSVNATIFFATDTFLSGYAKYAHPYDFYSIRYVLAGAEKLKQETRRIWMDKFGIRILEGYGATETAPVISVNTPMHYREGTVGRFLPGIRFTLLPVEGIKEGGRLIVSGPNIMKGYLKPDNPGTIEFTSTVVGGENWNGWYDTGDIVKVDEDNYITVLGRVKRFAKIGGEMVSLVAIEEMISELWPEFIHAVVYIDDLKKGEMLTLFTNKANPEREIITNFMRQKGYAEIYIPKNINFLEQLPILGTGKVDYVTLREMAANM